MTCDAETRVTVVRPQWPHAHLSIGDWLKTTSAARHRNWQSHACMASWCWQFQTPTLYLPDGFERESSHIALCTIQIVSKQFHSEKQGNNSVNMCKIKQLWNKLNFSCKTVQQKTIVLIKFSSITVNLGKFISDEATIVLPFSSIYFNVDPFQ